MTAVHLSRIDLNLLVVLETIHAEGGITRAAEKLHLTQPAISHALARLRETFDDPLFVRQGNAMVPTPLARRLIGPVGDALRTLDATFGGLERFDPATSSKRFAIGLRAVMESTVLPSLVQAALAQAPGVELSAVRVDRRRVESDLASGVLDVAIDVLLPVSESVRHARLSSDRMVVVARRGHPRIGDAMIKYTIEDAATGQPVTDPEPYLGAFAHLFILNEDLTSMAHAHPRGAEPTADSRGGPQIELHASLPKTGIYKLWGQFQRGGKVITSDWTLQAK